MNHNPLYPTIPGTLPGQPTLHPVPLRLDQAVDRVPRHWNDKAPQEAWNRTLPAIQIPQAMYEALQELSTNPEFEYGGKVAPIIREAIEEFVNKYTGDTNISGRMSLYRQMTAWRDAWAEEIIANNWLENMSVIETTLQRWFVAGDADMLVAALEKMMEGIKALPDEWRGFVVEKLRESDKVKEAVDWVKGEIPIEGRERRVVERVMNAVYSGEW